MTIKYPISVREAMLTAVSTKADAGTGAATIEVRSGSQPANADAAASGTLLGTFTCHDPSFKTATDSSGTSTIELDTDTDLTCTASATGTAGWARVKDSSGNTVFDGSVGTTGADFIITSTSITSGQTLTLTAGALNMTA